MIAQTFQLTLVNDYIYNLHIVVDLEISIQVAVDLVY